MTDVAAAQVMHGLPVLRKRHETDRAEGFSSIGKTVNPFSMSARGKCCETCLYLNACSYMEGPALKFKSLKVAMFFLPILLRSPQIASSYGNLRSQSRPYEVLAEKQLIKDIFSRRLSMKCLLLLWRLLVWILSLSPRSVQPFKLTYPLPIFAHHRDRQAITLNQVCFSFVFCSDGSTPFQPRPLPLYPTAAQVAKTKKDDDWLPQNRAKDNPVFEAGMLAIIYARP